MHPLLDDAAGAEVPHGVAELFARAELPAPVASALGLGCNPQVASEALFFVAFCRGWLCTLAQQFAAPSEAATHPHQYALSTRVGSEALVHSLQAAYDGDRSLTVLSVDGVGALDLFSRQAMLTALRDTPDANTIYTAIFFSAPFGDHSVFVLNGQSRRGNLEGCLASASAPTRDALVASRLLAKHLQGASI